MTPLTFGGSRDAVAIGPLLHFSESAVILHHLERSDSRPQLNLPPPTPNPPFICLDGGSQSVLPCPIDVNLKPIAWLYEYAEREWSQVEEGSPLSRRVACKAGSSRLRKGVSSFQPKLLDIQAHTGCMSSCGASSRAGTSRPGV